MSESFPQAVLSTVITTSMLFLQGQTGQGMPRPAPGPGQAPARRPHDPRMRGADPRQQAQPRPVQPLQQPQAQPQQSAAANLPAEQQKGICPVAFKISRSFKVVLKEVYPKMNLSHVPLDCKSCTSMSDGLQLVALCK